MRTYKRPVCRSPFMGLTIFTLMCVACSFFYVLRVYPHRSLVVGIAALAGMIFYGYLAVRKPMAKLTLRSDRIIFSGLFRETFMLFDSVKTARLQPQLDARKSLLLTLIDNEGRSFLVDHRFISSPDSEIVSHVAEALAVRGKSLRMML